LTLHVLFVASEAYPLIKTGGLGDVAGSLPRALLELKQDVRLIMPAYTDAVAQIETLTPITRFIEGNIEVTLQEGVMPGSELKVWLVDAPGFFDRPGNPYLDSNGDSWPDNAARFALFCRIASHVALDQAGLNWVPDVVHCHDWQSALVPALLEQASQRPATVFTIHNLAYQGLFPAPTLHELDLPANWWSPEALEFHGQVSFIKGALVFADRLNTVSPTYAREIQTPEFGYGLDGLLTYRAEALSGILNGIDTTEWDPATDSLLAKNYSADDMEGKPANKLALQQAFNLPQDPDTPLLGLISRLVPQKGIDIILDAMPSLVKLPLQMVLLGSGDRTLEAMLSEWARLHPDRVIVRIGYNESLAHHIEAGADIYLMPSRFEPCGLNQMYSLRYGTVPIVRNVGGLADTVVDTTTATLASLTATGFVVTRDDSLALLDGIKRSLALYADKPRWQQLQLTGMRQEFSWQQSASEYLTLYQQAMQANSKSLPATLTE
jgi:starch synthase